MTEPDSIGSSTIAFTLRAMQSSISVTCRAGVGLRIEHHELDAQLLGGALAAGDARLEVGDLQAEGHEADRLLVLRHGRGRRERDHRAQHGQHAFSLALTLLVGIEGFQ